MLQDVMEKVNEAEAQAGEIVSAARRQAAEIVEDAKIKAGERTGAAKARAREEAKKTLSQARRLGEEEKAYYAAKIDEELKLFKQRALQKEDAAVKALVNELL